VGLHERLLHSVIAVGAREQHRRAVRNRRVATDELLIGVHVALAGAAHEFVIVQVVHPVGPPGT